jgi:hypothetical protein
LKDGNDKGGFEMNRNTLLIAAATIGILAASNATYAQQEHGAQPGGVQRSQAAPGSNQAPRNPGGAAQQERGRSETTGQGQVQSHDREHGGQAEQNRGRGEITGQGQIQNRDRDRNGQAQPGRDRDRNNQAQQDRDRDRQTQQNREQNRNRNETTGQAPQNAPRDQNRVNENRRPNESGAVNQREDRTTGQGAAGSRANVNLTSEQRTRIHEVITMERSAPRVTSVNFDVRVGTRVPRTVRFAPLPATVIEIAPVWRGYEYFLVRDEIIVVDPRTMEIVAVIEA